MSRKDPALAPKLTGSQKTALSELSTLRPGHGACTIWVACGREVRDFYSALCQLQRRGLVSRTAYGQIWSITEAGRTALLKVPADLKREEA